MRRLLVFALTLLGMIGAAQADYCKGIDGTWTLDGGSAGTDTYVCTTLSTCTYSHVPSGSGNSCSLRYALTWNGTNHNFDATASYVSGTCSGTWPRSGTIIIDSGSACTGFTDSIRGLGTTRTAGANSIVQNGTACEVPGHISGSTATGGENASVGVQLDDGCNGTCDGAGAAWSYKATLNDPNDSAFNFGGRAITEVNTGPQDKLPACNGNVPSNDPVGWSVSPDYNEDVGGTNDNHGTDNGWDNIGFTDKGLGLNYVNYVRGNAWQVLPCYYSWHQTMWINCPVDNVPFQTHQNYIKILKNDIAVSRNGTEKTIANFGKPWKVFRDKDFQTSIGNL